MIHPSGTECKHFGKVVGSDAFGEAVFECPKMGGGICQLDECSRCSKFELFRFPDWEWAVGITSAPRVINGKRTYPYLDATRLGLDASGFPHPKVYDDERLQLGAWGNFQQAALDLHLRHPHASAYLILQDDTVLEPDCAPVVEEFMAAFPVDVAIVSLYLPPDLGQSPNDGRRWDLWSRHDRGWHSPGACAYVFQAWALRDLLCDRHSYYHRRLGPTGGMRCTDSVVGVWASQWGGIWYPDEPMAKHIGEVTACEKER